MPGPTSLLFADDNALARRIIRSLLADAFQGSVCAEAADGAEAVEKAKAMCPRVVILDIVMPKLNGLEAAEEILSSCPGTVVLAISSYDPKPISPRMASAGVRGFIPKSMMATELVPAIEALLEGRTYFLLN
jgi:two-component system, NarL family, response regulator NreC